MTIEKKKNTYSEIYSKSCIYVIPISSLTQTPVWGWVKRATPQGRKQKVWISGAGAEFQKYYPDSHCSLWARFWNFTTARRFVITNGRYDSHHKVCRLGTEFDGRSLTEKVQYAFFRRKHKFYSLLCFIIHTPKQASRVSWSMKEEIVFCKVLFLKLNVQNSYFQLFFVLCQMSSWAAS